MDRLARTLAPLRRRLSLRFSSPSFSTDSEPANLPHQNHSPPTDESTAPAQDEDRHGDNDAPDVEGQEQEYKNPHTGEVGGPKGPEPTRFGDWEKGGRCYDF